MKRVRRLPGHLDTIGKRASKIEESICHLINSRGVRLKNNKLPVPPERIHNLISVVRGQSVIIDADLARLYGVTTKRLNEQVKRNKERFPKDFCFQLSKKEWTDLRSQTATSNIRHGGRRYPPYVFTEHGALMAANVLNSQQAVEMSVRVVRAFIEMRQLIASSEELAERLRQIEMRMNRNDKALKAVVAAVRQLITKKKKTPARIGFLTGERQ